MEIKKKINPEYFKDILNGKKKIELRLADFSIKTGDILVLEEYNPKTKQYTGRNIKKKVNFLVKVDLLKLYSIEDIKKFGIYEIGLD